jgi:hypothetical protein
MDSIYNLELLILLHTILIQPSFNSYNDKLYFYIFIASLSISLYPFQTNLKQKNGVFWDVTPCGSYKNRRFGGSWRLFHQGDKNPVDEHCELYIEDGVSHYEQFLNNSLRNSLHSNVRVMVLYF